MADMANRLTSEPGALFHTWGSSLMQDRQQVP